jgi:hypothetical protein
VVYLKDAVWCTYVSNRLSIESRAIQNVYRGKTPGIEKNRCHLLIRPCIVATAIKNSPLLLVNRNFTRAEGLPIRQVAVQNAVPYVSNLIVDKEIPLVGETVEDFAIVIHVKCTLQPVQVVGMRHKCPFNHEMTDLSIAVIVINRNVLVAQTTNDRVGNFHDKDFSESRRLVRICTETFPAQGAGCRYPGGGKTA